MALQFKCSNCKKTITVKHLAIGEEARCFHCGTVNVVPENSIETDSDPDYKRYKYTEKVYKTRRADIFRPSLKQLLISALFATAFAIFDYLFSHDFNSSSGDIFAIIGIFLGSYMGSYIQSLFINEEKEIQKFTNSAAPRNTKCINCEKNIIKGEPVFISSNYVSRLLKKELILCIKCFNDYKLSLMQSWQKGSGKKAKA